MKLKDKLGLLGASFLVGMGAAATPAAAQTPQPVAAEEEETIIVTGSRIRRDPANAPAPLIQVTQEEITLSGDANVIDFLVDIPALSGSNVPEDTTGANLNDGGLSLLDLRDLGTVRTLTLVDGRRHVGAPQGQLAVDVSSIPSLLINNVEVVTGGQSALYGGDAVSGVVNFILRRDFEGLEIDGSLNQINQDGQQSRRLSALAGVNLLDDRLNIYISGEYQKFDEVQDADIDWAQEGWTILNNDSDLAPNATTADGQLDNILINNARDAFFVRGGLFIVASQVRPNATFLTDPDIPGQISPVALAQMNAAIRCAPPAGQTNQSNIIGTANCFNHGIELGTSWVFDTPGTARGFNFGTFQDQNGVNRRVNVGGDGLNVGTEFAQGSRVPFSEETRFQGGVNFDVTDDVQLFVEAKRTHEETFDEGQPTFFQGGIGTPVAGLPSAIFGTTNFNVGTDNAYIPTNLRNAILSNTRAVYDLNPASPTFRNLLSTVADPRGSFNMFGPIRTQFNTRELERYVAGVRGSLDQFLMLNDVDWEIAGTYGRVENQNQENAVDVIRFAYAADAVVDTGGALGTPGAIVCRVRLLNQLNPGTVPDQWNGGFHAPPGPGGDPEVETCVPNNIFGVDMRQAGYNPAAEAYYNASITVNHVNMEQDIAGTVSGTLWDLWGAGPLGLAVGYEWRNEKTYGVGRTTGTAGRLLFLNTGPDFAPAAYDVQEAFAELNVPLFRDHPLLGESGEFSIAYRASDYSVVGGQEAKSAQFQWRPFHELMLRSTYGESLRIPTLNDMFAPATQTFGNGFVDPCSQPNIDAQPEPQRSWRVANCAALGIPAGTILNYPSGVPGFNSGNPNLTPETGRSFTHSVSYQPDWLPNSAFVIDYYDIRISDVIAATTVQQAANNCVSSGPSLNTPACLTITRNPGTFLMTSFVQGQTNFAKLRTNGIDFSANYHLDLEDAFSLNWGSLDWRLRGNYLIRNENFLNASNPGIETVFDTTLGFPRVRFQLTSAWSPTENLQFSWNWDWQAEQELQVETLLATDPDNRDPALLVAPDYSQHDFNVTWNINDNLRLRGGVVNAFDNDPVPQVHRLGNMDQYDLFGRRFFVGVNFRN